MLRHVTAPDGVRLGADVAGSGPALVMAHGAGAGRWGFDAVRPLLEERFTVWALDRRGRGASADGEAYDVRREFDDVAAVVREAGEGSLLFGHSYGGLVSAGAAGRLDGLPRLVLYEPPMGGVLADEARIERLEADLAAGDRDAAVRRFLRDIAGYPDEEVEAMRKTPAWEKRLEVATTVPRELRAEREFDRGELGLDRLDVPTLLLVGSESPDWAQHSTDAYAAEIPGAEVRTLEGHGHGAAVAGPELLAEELTAFLRD